MELLFSPASVATREIKILMVVLCLAYGNIKQKHWEKWERDPVSNYIIQRNVSKASLKPLEEEYLQTPSMEGSPAESTNSSFQFLFLKQWKVFGKRFLEFPQLLPIFPGQDSK